MFATDERRSCMRVFATLLLGGVMACNANRGYRPLKLVIKDSAALRSRTLLDLERSLVFPRCTHKPSAAYACGLGATRQAERDIESTCGEAICKRQKIEALYASIQQRAESLGVDVRAIDLRCGAPCRDLRALELEVLRTSGESAAARAQTAYLHADSIEREAIEREKEEADVKKFDATKKQRDEVLAALLVQFRRELLEAARDGATLPHATLCGTESDCTPDVECTHFRGASVGLCQKE